MTKDDLAVEAEIQGKGHNVTQLSLDNIEALIVDQDYPDSLARN